MAVCQMTGMLPRPCQGVTSPQLPRAWAGEEVMNQSCQDADTAVLW